MRKYRRSSIRKTVTKEARRVFFIMILGVMFISTAITIQYKPVYGVTIDGETVGYVEDKELFETEIQNEIMTDDSKNVEDITLNKQPQYEKQLIERSKQTNEADIIEKLGKEVTITYKFYVVTLNKTKKTYVDTLEDAEKVVEKIKSEYKGNGLELDLTISEKYTNKKEKVKTDTVEVAELSIEEEITKLIKEKQAKQTVKTSQTKQSQQAKKTISTVKGFKVSTLPVSGKISSRFGEVSSIRSGAHTGLDIACKKGTKIKAVAAGTVTFAAYKGAYGNIIKIDHGNGVETWYAHCSRIIAKEGTKVSAGTVIGEVGSTGNATGPHLHIEVRIEGTPVNPQRYLYNK